MTARTFLAVALPAYLLGCLAGALVLRRDVGRSAATLVAALAVLGGGATTGSEGIFILSEGGDAYSGSGGSGGDALDGSLGIGSLRKTSTR